MLYAKLKGVCHNQQQPFSSGQSNSNKHFPQDYVTIFAFYVQK